MKNLLTRLLPFTVLAALGAFLATGCTATVDVDDDTPDTTVVETNDPDVTVVETD